MVYSTVKEVADTVTLMLTQKSIVLFDCPIYKDLRKCMSDAISKTNDHFECLTGEEKMYFLMNSSDESIMNCVAKYICFIYRVERKSQCMSSGNTHSYATTIIIDCFM